MNVWRYPYDRLGMGGVSSRRPTRTKEAPVINLDYPLILQGFPQHLDPKRSESASFLIWYLENYYRLDPVEAVDAVCDQKGDKGVDGVYVNDNDQTITVFQARISQRPDRTIGDAALKEFVGTLGQFKDKAAIQELMASAGSADVATLIKRLDLVNKVETHSIIGEFITNIDVDANGEAYLVHAPTVTFVGKSGLVATYVSDSREVPKSPPVRFDIQGFQASEYTVDAEAKAVIAPIKARELVRLEGIADQSLFAYNVRGPHGRTQVNKDIVKSVSDVGRHRLFPLFHNGITIVASDVTASTEAITTSEYFVVNGCQSLTALYDNRAKLTDDLRVLVKFIKIDPGSKLAEMVTQFSKCPL